MFTGPKIVTEGLVFGFDTGYPQTTGSLLPQYRFNKGEPTENIRASTGLDSSYASSGRVIDNSGTLTAPNGTTGWSSITSVGDQNAGYRIAKFTYNNVTQDVEYTFSLELYNPGPNALEIFVDGNAGYSGTTIPLGHSIYSFTLTPPANRVQAIFFGTENKTSNVSYSPSRVILFKNYQVEVKDHATPFTDGTRSVSDSLIDLTGTNNIDLSNVSFDSNAQISFDGTDDKITQPYDMSNMTEFSIEFWAKTYNTGSDGGDANTALAGPNAGGTYIRTGFSKTNSRLSILFYVDGAENQKSMSTIINYSDFNPLEYNHYAFTIQNNDSMNIYFNGELKNTETAGMSDLMTTGLDNYYQRIGNYAGAYLWQGEIPICRLYDKKLSDKQILQSYNACKKRFGH